MRTGFLKKITAMGLAACLAGSLLAGCGAAEDTKDPVPPSETGKEEEIEPMGRYVETEIELPEGIENDRFISFFRGKDGKLELYTALPNDQGNLTEAKRFVREGDGWKQEEAWWERVKPRDISVEIRRVFYGLDGKYYFSAMSSEEYIYHLYQIQEEGESEELFPELFLPPEGRDYGMIPTKAEVGADGSVILHNIDEVTCYKPNGEKRFSMAKSWGGTSESSIGYATEEEFITKTDSGVARYRLSDGQLTETIPFDETNGLIKEADMVMFGDGNGGIYVANENGLAHLGAGGSLWELLIDGSLNTMGMRSCYLQEFLQGDDQDYYGIYVTNSDWSGILLCRYSYDPNASSAPPAKITVYGLKDNSTVRQAAALFQKSHPDVRVEVLSSVEEGKGVSEEMIRALNTELLSGKGADVLILDGLPWKSYEEKGVLMDMRDVFGSMGQDEPLMESVVAGFTREDGSIYQMPARFCVPVLIGEEREIQAFDSLEAMAAYDGERPLLPADTYENILRLTASLQYPELFGERGDGLSEEMLVKYLKTAKAVGEKNGSKTMFTEEEMERLWINNHTAPFGIRGSAIHFDGGLSACGVENMDGLFDLIIPRAVMERHPEASMKNPHGIYFPMVLAGINQATAQPELAGEFVKCLFSMEVQKEQFSDGFPVNGRAQEENCNETTRENISVGSGIGDYHIGGSYPKPESRKEFYEIIGHLSQPVMVDETVMGMIVNGARDYFDGKVTAEEAASSILRQITLYQAEQG